MGDWSWEVVGCVGDTGHIYGHIYLSVVFRHSMLTKAYKAMRAKSYGLTMRSLEQVGELIFPIFSNVVKTLYFFWLIQCLFLLSQEQNKKFATFKTIIFQGGSYTIIRIIS